MAGAALERSGAAADPREGELDELRDLFRQLFRAFIRVRGRDTHLAEGQLSQAQFELMVELADRGPLPAGELAAVARLSPGAVTQMLDHLAEEGHVERVRSQSDRRVVVSRLTRKGRGRIETKRREFAARWRAAMEGVEADELKAASRVLERVCEMLDQGPAVASRGASDEGAKSASQPARG